MTFIKGFIAFTGIFWNLIWEAVLFLWTFWPFSNGPPEADIVFSDPICWTVLLSAGWPSREGSCSVKSHLTYSPLIRRAHVTKQMTEHEACWTSETSIGLRARKQQGVISILIVHYFSCRNMGLTATESFLHLTEIVFSHLSCSVLFSLCWFSIKRYENRHC